MKKLIIIAISMIAGWACAYAAEPNGLEVTLCDGATATVLFDANPELSFTGSKLVVTLPDRDGLTYELDAVESIVFKTVSGAEDIIADAITMQATAAGVTFGNLGVGTPVTVYDLQGRAVQCAVADGSFTLERSTLPRGVYIVKINNFTTKLSF